MGDWFMGKTHHVTADVVVIGGGTAGLNCAMAAAEKGAKVLVVDKAHIMRSGAIAGGIDHFHAYLETGPEWDTRESYLKFVAKVSNGASNLKIHEKVFCDELRPAIDRMDRIGVTLKNKEGKFFRTQAIGQPGAYAINFNGKFLKPAMAKEVARLGCKVLNRVQVTKLLVHDGKLAGFCGWDMRTGDFYQVQAKAVILATGNTNRMYKSQTDNPFNLWYCPANTGDLHTAAYEAGVELANIEYVRMTIVPKGFSAPGFNAFFGMGAKLVNSLGKQFMSNYHPAGDLAPRYMMVWGSLQEVRQGRGPIYVDVRHLKPKELEHLFFTLGIDKDTLPDFLMKKGYALEGSMIELVVSEPMQARPSELCGSGIKIDENCMSNIPGIFAAGDASDQMGCLHMCVCGGYAAGKSAAEYAAKVKDFAPLDEKALAEEHKRIMAPIARKSGMSYGEFETMIRIIATDHMVWKTEMSLTTGIRKLNGLDKYRDQLKANNLHELMRCQESLNIQSVAKLSAHAALARKESRFGPYHSRADYPETNPDFCGLIVVRKQGDEVTTRFEKLSYN